MTDPTFLGQSGHDPAHAWMAAAACIGHDPELWFPGTGDQIAATAAAKAVCRDCPVAEPCLTAALADPHLQGVWGGLTQPERRGNRRGNR